MKRKPFVGVAMAFVAGLLLGFYLAHPVRVRAQSSVAHVTRIILGQQHLLGEVVGFSCGPQEGVVICYALSR